MTAVQTELTSEALLAMPESDYMNDTQLRFFTQFLQQQRTEVEEHLKSVREEMTQQDNAGDEADHAIVEEELRLLLRQAERETKLLGKIDKALDRIRQGEYGYCMETGAPIGLKRLLLRPTAELCTEAKQMHEEQESHYQKQRGYTL